MQPTIQSGRFILVSSLPYFLSNPKVEDLVLIAVKNQTMIKRIKRVENKNKFYVMGDNVKKSTDSRSFGLVDRSQILAKVVSFL